MLPDLSILFFRAGGLVEREQCFHLAVAFLEPDVVGVEGVAGISEMLRLYSVMRIFSAGQSAISFCAQLEHCPDRNFQWRFLRKAEPLLRLNPDQTWRVII